MDHRDSKGFTVHTAAEAMMAAMEKRVRMVIKAQKDIEALTARRVRRGVRVKMGNVASMERRGHKALLANRDQKETKDPKETMDIVAIKASVDFKVAKVVWGRKVNEARKATKGMLGRKVIQAKVDHKVLKVAEANEDTKARKA